jgi:MEDS: MEthanogen/methylotroph, DcmR Sensory domain
MHSQTVAADLIGRAAAASNQPVRLGGSLLGERRHVCAFFNSREDEYRVTLPFIKDGFEAGDRAFHIVGSGRLDDHLQRMSSARIDTVTTQRTGQLELYDWEQTYFSSGYFDPDSWLALVEETLARGRRQGFVRSRVLAHMEWALEDRVGVDRLVEYEAKLNHVWPRSGDVGICTYDLAKFGGDVILDILRTHPLVIIGGILQENPFFVEPDEFLEELRARRAD